MHSLNRGYERKVSIKQMKEELKEKEIFSMFLRRILPDTFFYVLTLVLITVFYQLSTGKSVEILYPYSIALVIYLVWMGSRYVSYSKLMHSLKKLQNNCAYEGNFTYKDEQLLNKIFVQVHREYLQALQTREVEEQEQRRFLSAWIHSMKTPVTVMDLVTQRVQLQELEQGEAFVEIKQENQKLLSSLDLVLNMLRLKEFAKDYIPEQFDLYEEIKQIINANKSLFIYSHVYPKVICLCEEGKQTMVLSDRKWNRHMIEQLISNAIKYSKEEGESKNVIFRISRQGNQCVLTIEDEGIGIEETDLQRIFEPFFTGENGRNGRNSSGIGLYFCKEISKHIQCDLTITSQVGKGTTVRIVYPDSSMF